MKSLFPFNITYSTEFEFVYCINVIHFSFKTNENHIRKYAATSGLYVRLVVNKTVIIFVSTPLVFVPMGIRITQEYPVSESRIFWILCRSN